MRTTLIFTLLSMASAAAFSATVYKWVDDQGATHYSDQPHENAEQVELKAPQTYSAPKMTGSTRPTVAPPRKPAPVYRSCTISAPVDDQVFLNTDTVTAGVVVQPAVRPGDQVIVTLDGLRVPGVPQEGGGFTISPVDRGTHSMLLVVQDPAGKPMCQSGAVTFHVRQPSVLAPNNPNNPNRPHR